MISPETRVQIRRYFYAEHWKIGTIAQALDVHPDTVRPAIEVERFHTLNRCGHPLSIRICLLCARCWSSIHGCAPRASTR